jgi:hypothetical protein
MSWTDEERAQAIKAYLDSEPTAENSMDIVNQISEEMDKTPNGVRMILMKAEKYVNKTPQSTSTAGTSSTGSKRVSKDDAHAQLREAITAKGLEPDEDIITKLTGKAALYVASIVSAE